MIVKKKDTQQLLVKILIIMFVMSLLLYSKFVVSAAQKGLLLWFNLVLPSLFPFAVGTYLLIEYGLIEWIGYLFEPLMKPLFKISGIGAFAWIMGITSGYPMGAMITADLVKKKELTVVEGQRLLNLSNQAGPLFILGAVSVGILQWPQIGIYILIIQYLSAISMGVFFRFYGPVESKKSTYIRNTRKPKKNIYSSSPILGTVLKKSVINAMDLLLQIGGFIILFSVIIEIMTQWQVTAIVQWFLLPFQHWLPLHPTLQKICFFPLIEITNGIQIINETSAPVLQKLLLINGAIAWSGFSIHAQTASVLQGSQLKMSVYIIGKGIQSILAFFYTLLLFTLIKNKIPSPTFYSTAILWKSSSDWSFTLIQSTIRFGVAYVLLIMIGLFCSYFLFPRNS